MHALLRTANLSWQAATGNGLQSSQHGLSCGVQHLKAHDFCQRTGHAATHAHDYSSWLRPSFSSKARRSRAFLRARCSVSSSLRCMSSMTLRRSWALPRLHQQAGATLSQHRMQAVC